MTSKIVTPEFRGSFVSLAEPRTIPGAAPGTKPKYQITLALPKDDPFWAEAEQQIEAAYMERWGKKPPKFRSPIKDGDEMERAEFADMYTLQFSSFDRPGLVDSQMKPVVDPDELYSGAWYRVSCRAYAWSHPTGGNGVSFSLDNAMKCRDDEAYSGKTSASDDFGAFAATSNNLLD